MNVSVSLCLYDTCVHVLVTHVCMYWKRLEEGVGSIGTSGVSEVLGGYKLPDKGAMN